jgi:HK97 gp10 family phage protein
MAGLKKVGTTGSVGGVVITQDNTEEVLAAVEQAITKAMTKIGIKVERYAKNLCPVGTPESTGKKGYRGGTLRNSITFEVEDKEVAIGSNVEYAPYVELGTGPNFTPPPSWETFQSTKGSGIGGGYVHARPFLRPAVEDHLSEYEDIVKGEFKS